MTWDEQELGIESVESERDSYSTPGPSSTNARCAVTSGRPSEVVRIAIARTAPATNPPICAHHATPVAAPAPIDDTPLIVCITNHMPKKMGAGSTNINSGGKNA